MWANFGPAVQVKHLSLGPQDFEGICGCLQAEQIVVVCKKVEAKSIQALLSQIGFANRIRGIITDADLTKWYQLACNAKYRNTLGRDAINAILNEVSLEFPVTQVEKINKFLKGRGYDLARLQDFWAIKSDA